MPSPSVRKDGPAHTLLARAHSPDTADSIQDDLLRRPLLLGRTTLEDQPYTARDARRRERERKADAKRRRKRKPAPLSASQKRALSLYEIPAEQRQWDVFAPVHQLWLAYVREVLGVEATMRANRTLDPQFVGSTITNGDLHGALVEVVKCRSPGRVGIAGIVAKETRGTFEIITKRNQLKVIPKEHTTFRLEIPYSDDGEEKVIVELLGDQFLQRPAERSTKKYKIKIPKDL